MMLNAQPDMDVIGEAHDGRQAIQESQRLRPDIVLMDITMPDLNGIEATRGIIAAIPDVKVIGLSMHTDRRFVVGMLKAGASGDVLKDAAFEELSQAILTVVAGRTYLSPALADIVLKDYLTRVPEDAYSAVSLLSLREREVLQLISEGKTTKQIADDLQVSSKTIETHRQQIMEKIGVYSIAALTKYAVREGLTSLDT